MKQVLIVLFVTLAGRVVTIDDDQILWQTLVKIPTSSLRSAFLPSYVDFDADILSNQNVSSACRVDLQTSLEAFDQRLTWAYQMFNAWGRFPPSGTFEGTLTDYGDYDQCMTVNDALLPQASLQTEYCLIDVAVPMPPMPKAHNFYQHAKVLPENEASSTNATLFRHFESHSSVFYYVYGRVGVCLPVSCRREDIAAVALRDTAGIGLKLKRVSCQQKTQWRPSLVQLVAIITLATVLILMLAAAIVDRLASYEAKSAGALAILLWFSPLRNVRKLICTKSHDDLTCVHGLRFLTMVWIIFGHALEWNSLNSFRDTFKIADNLSALAMQPLLKGHYTVETFFYLSGMLTSYVTLKYTASDYKNFRGSVFLLMRYLRLTPQLGVFLLATTLLPPMFSGPLWSDYIAPVAEKCSVTWWRNLIYVHNLIDLDNICSMHTWYLAADMQLHWASLVPVLLLLQNRTWGVRFTKGIIFVCLLFTAASVYLQKLPPGAIITSRNDFMMVDEGPTKFTWFFFQPLNHANVFFIGFIFGATLQRLDLSKYVMRKSVKYLCWFTVLIGYLFCVYSTLPWLYGRPYTPAWSALFYPLNTTVWAAVITLLIWLCITNNGSIVGRLLSWSGFRPLSRVTYSVYLTHVWVLWVYMGTRRDLIDLSTRSIMLLVTGLVSISYGLGFLFTISFETPVIHLIDYVKNNFLAKKALEEEDKMKELKLIEVQMVD